MIKLNGILQSIFPEGELSYLDCTSVDLLIPTWDRTSRKIQIFFIKKCQMASMGMYDVGKWRHNTAEIHAILIP